MTGYEVIRDQLIGAMVIYTYDTFPCDDGVAMTLYLRHAIIENMEGDSNFRLPNDLAKYLICQTLDDLYHQYFNEDLRSLFAKLPSFFDFMLWIRDKDGQSIIHNKGRLEIDYSNEFFQIIQGLIPIFNERLKELEEKED